MNIQSIHAYTFREQDDDGAVLHEVPCTVAVVPDGPRHRVVGVYEDRAIWKPSKGWCKAGEVNILESPLPWLRDLGIRIVSQVEADDAFHELALQERVDARAA